jgi:uncharacterized protein (TIGR03000 family)
MPVTYTAQAPVQTAPATLTVTLPADAKLLIDNTPTKSTSATRTFVTPPLASGRTYTYTLTAEVVRAGETKKVTQEVVVKAGEESKAVINLPAMQTAAR